MKTKPKEKILFQGAEAIIYREKEFIVKKRIPKKYRLSEIDQKIRKLRTRNEAKILKKAGEIIPAPKVHTAEEKSFQITMEFLEGKRLSNYLNTLPLKKQQTLMENLGKNISLLHSRGIIHGDLTTSNMIYQNKKIYLIDFGLSFQNGKYEDKAVDLHLFKQALEAKHFENWQTLFKSFEKGYSKNSEFAKKVFERLKAVEKRGRYRH
jgi:TP53 regulating kinase and related kinases